MSLPTLDIRILLDFLQTADGDALKSDLSAQLASLETLSRMCTNVEAVSCIRDQDGVNLIWNLCCSTKSLEISHACFFALSCIVQNHIYAQHDLCLDHVFKSLIILLDSDKALIKTKTLVSYLILSLVSNNKQGQNCVSSSGCLDKMSSLFISCSEDLRKADCSLEKFELFKVLAKTLSYSASVPQNDENQLKLVKILPWIVNGVHFGLKNLEVTRLSCDLLAVAIEDNEDSQRQAIRCCATEALILLINSLFPSKGDECLGCAVIALSQVLANSDSLQLKKFLAFGGSTVLLKLTLKEPSEKWQVHHVNQTLTLLMKCFESCRDQFNAEYLNRLSQNVVKLMRLVPGDDFFHKMSVQLLSFLLEATPLALPPASSIKDDIKFAHSSTSSPCTLIFGENSSNDVWPITTVVPASSPEQKSPLKTEPCVDSPTIFNRQPFTTIFLNTKRNKQRELTLDISKSSKQALRRSSGIEASPTDNVFPHPPNISALSSTTSEQSRQQKLRKKNFLRPASHQQRSLKSCLSDIHQRLNEKHSTSRIAKSSSFRYSTPKSHKFSSDCRLKFSRQQRRNCRPAVDNSDVISLCEDLIDREVLNSVKKRKCHLSFGSSGLLGRK